MIFRIIWACLVKLFKLISVIPLSIVFIIKWIGVIIATPITFLIVAIIEIRKVRRGENANISNFRPPFGDG